jgi:toxin ParE1/3/4
VSFLLHLEAEEELTQAAMFYAEQASSKIAQAFLGEFERVATLLQENQQLGSLAKAGLRVHPLRRFPYSVIYRETDAGPFILAVAHQRQEPGFWQSRTGAGS